ncbi:leucine-rich repeat domain-containing protein [Agaribacterium sp. ZY112]|uniref:leucine-rich repeat domain-containing protein n=1 Tax=Agaribacterium sp. ZY112 TaxID=3233574 RepID=UPI00352653D4
MPHAPFHHIKYLAAAFILSACSNYEWSVNDNVVYSPAPLFNDFDKRDAALSTCLKDSIKEFEVRKAEELDSLFCPSGKIQHIQALSVFTNIEKLGLANNHISDASPLSELSKLRFVDLRGNSELACETVSTLTQIEQLYLPEHCN